MIRRVFRIKAGFLKSGVEFSECGQIYDFAGECSDRRTHTSIYHFYSGLNDPSGKPAVDKCGRKKIFTEKEHFVFEFHR